MTVGGSFWFPGGARRWLCRNPQNSNSFNADRNIRAQNRRAGFAERCRTAFGKLPDPFAWVPGELELHGTIVQPAVRRVIGAGGP